MRRAVTGNQFVTDDKRVFARHLRREMTPHERKVWETVRDRRLGGFKFRRQQIIEGYIADFYCPSAAVVLELDGAVHADQREYDAYRDRVLSARQIVVVRMTNSRIDAEFMLVLAELEQLCRQRVGSG